MKLFIAALTVFFYPASASAQKSDSVFIRKIFEYALTKGDGYKNLEVLCKDYGKRLAGSQGAAGAVTYTNKLMKQYGFDSVWLQPCMVPHWERGEKETAYYSDARSQKKELTICALGNSIGTSLEGLSAPVIEVTNFRQLDSLGRKNIQGKIVFYNHAMDQTKISPFEAYGEAVQYRWAGPDRASKYGAVGVVVRSVSTALDDYPHTGAMHYGDTVPQIPACAVSTLDAEDLSAQLKRNPGTRFYFRQTCKMLPDEPSYNVIGELRGTAFPNEFITVGGHLDAWETGTGAQDDGAGAVQSMDVLYFLKSLGLRPKHTIRAVLFMNEENGGKGGLQYAEDAKAKNEKHLFAVESDAGGFSPLGFTLDGDSAAKAKIRSWRSLFVPYRIYEFDHEGGAADIEHLKDFCKVLSGLSPDPQRYFDYHHAGSDTFDKVNRRELEMGAAAMAALIYLVDEYGL